MKRNNPNQVLEETIQSIFDEHDGNYGYRRIQLELRNRGVIVNHKKVQRIMRKLGAKDDKFIRKSRGIAHIKERSQPWQRTEFTVVSIRRFPIKN
ncbi:hypothetical protein CSV66_01965 [Sporosarcina sp. P30]|nr:hypothetical protein CSV66_01965 [Sporosarcina sp. P30]